MRVNFLLICKYHCCNQVFPGKPKKIRDDHEDNVETADECTLNESFHQRQAYSRNDGYIFAEDVGIDWYFKQSNPNVYKYLGI